MKTTLFTLMVFTIIIVQTSYSQYNPITSEEYEFLLNRKFRSLVANGNYSVPGSFAGLELTDAKVGFSPAFQFKNGNVISGKINAAATGGIADIFKNSKLNTNVSGGLDFNFLNHKGDNIWLLKFPTRTIHTDYDQKAVLDKKGEAVKRKFLLDSLSIATGEKMRELNKSFKDKYVKDTTLFNQLKGNLSASQTASWQTLISMDKKEWDSVQSISSDPTELSLWISRELRDARAIRDAAKKELSTDKIEVTGCQLGWWTIGGEIRQDAFKRYDPILNYNDRLIDEKYLSKQLRVSYSYLKLSKERKRIRFFNIGFTWNMKSNYQDLKTLDLTIETAQGSDSLSTTSSTKKYTAYVGEYKKHIDEAIINVDYYHFFTNTFAWHAYSTWRMYQGMRPELNIGGGIIHSFLDKKDQKSFINTEVYFTFINIWQAINANLDVFDQSKIGLRFTFPINFN